MGYSSLKAALDAVIRTNGQQQITGANLNGVMTTLLQGVDVMDRENPADTSGLNHVVLKKGSSFSSQVSGANTLYEVRDSFDLGGASVNIPAGCALKFNGGNLTNGTLVLNNTIFLGDYEDSINVTLSGTNMTPDFKIGVTSSPSVAASKIETAYKGINVVSNITLSQQATIHSNMRVADGVVVTIQSSVENSLVLDSGVVVEGGTFVKQLEHIDSRDTFRRILFFSTATRDIIIRNCTIKGGINFASGASDDPGQNVIIENCIIDVDFTAIMGSAADAQDDVIVMFGYSNVIIRNNIIKAVNNNRVVKLSSASIGSDYSVQYNIADNILIENNSIDSHSSGLGSHQLLDGYVGLAGLVVRNNVIKSRGHEHLFEQKTEAQNRQAILIYENNKIDSDRDVLFINMTEKDSVHFNNNVININNPISSSIADIIMVKQASFYCHENIFNGNGNINESNAIITCHRTSANKAYTKNVSFKGNRLNNFGRVNLMAENVSCENNFSDNTNAYCFRFNAKRLEYSNNNVSSEYAINLIKTGANDLILEYLFVSAKTGEVIICDSAYLLDQPLADVIAILQGSSINTILSNRFSFGAEIGGVTSNRPGSPKVGWTYFDTTIGKTIVWNGSAWVNMDGSALS